MTEKITLRAKSDGTELEVELADENAIAWVVRLAEGVNINALYKSEWERVYALPTKPGAVFRATVRRVENVRVMYAPEGDGDPRPYFSSRPVLGYIRHAPEVIDPSTVVIELEGIDE